jgi:hypothetical protein
VTGAAAGVQKGIGSGSHSTPAAALTLGALGVAGLIEWPVVLAIGGGALLLRQLNNSHNNGARDASAKPVKAVPTKSTGSTAQRKSPAKRAPAGQARGTRPRSRR